MLVELMKVLLGTTTPLKVKRFSNFLEGCDIEFIALKDIEIIDEPKEDEDTPEEKAISKLNSMVSMLMVLSVMISDSILKISR